MSQSAREEMGVGMQYKNGHLHRYGTKHTFFIDLYTIVSDDRCL